MTVIKHSRDLKLGYPAAYRASSHRYLSGQAARPAIKPAPRFVPQTPLKRSVAPKKPANLPRKAFKPVNPWISGAIIAYEIGKIIYDNSSVVAVGAGGDPQINANGWTLTNTCVDLTPRWMLQGGYMDQSSCPTGTVDWAQWDGYYGDMTRPAAGHIQTVDFAGILSYFAAPYDWIANVRYIERYERGASLSTGPFVSSPQPKVYPYEFIPISPHVNPLLNPIGKPWAAPRLRPRLKNRIRPNPLADPYARPQRNARPRRNPSTGRIRLAYNSHTGQTAVSRNTGFTPRKPPPKGTKEKKLKVNKAGALFLAVLWDTGEVIDMIGAIHRTLPDGSFGLNPTEQLVELYEQFDSLDLATALEAAAQQILLDSLIGGMSQSVGASREGHGFIRSTGIAL